ncbi:MAG: hypothetical protein LRY27_02935 [Chitinophagales bacterium]|nr:hypothetical protein [Chitinophagales bacterium]
MAFLNAKAQTYSGYIGKYPIIMDITPNYDGNNSWAYYFYQSTLKNIMLDGESKGNKIILYARYSDKEEAKELFALTDDGNTLKGTWQNNGKTLDVTLTKEDIDISEYIIKKLTFERDSISKHGDKELVWIIEKYSQIKLFRLGNGFTEKQRNFLNPILDTMQQFYALDELLYCARSDIDIEISLVNNDFVSYLVHYYEYCYGAHPNYGAYGNTFDLKNLKIIENFSELYPNVDVFQLLKKKI